MKLINNLKNLLNFRIINNRYNSEHLNKSIQK
jgi:hypothetical protein